jgi:hypothetical protein
MVLRITLCTITTTTTTTTDYARAFFDEKRTGLFRKKKRTRDLLVWEEVCGYAVDFLLTVATVRN